MRNPVTLIANLAALLHLARHAPEDTAAFEDAMAALRQGLGDGELVIDASISRLYVNGNALHPDAPGAKDLIENLLVHDAGSLHISASADAAALDRVLRLLSAPAGTYLTFQSLIGTIGPDALREVKIGPNPASLVVHGRNPVTLDPGSGRSGTDSGLVAEAGSLILEPLAFEAPAQRLGPQDPQGEDPRDADDRRRLRALVDRGRTALATERWDELFEVGLALLKGSEEGSSDSVRQGYKLELKRLASRKALRGLVRFTAVGDRRREAALLLHRVGGDAAEILMERLVEAESINERRGYFAALSTMPEAAPVIVYHLGHPSWYVVRNAADLCGDLDLVDAIPELAKQIHHSDERVRRAVAGALAKIGTAGAMEPVRLALSDSATAVRLEALMHLDGRRRGRSLAMVLAAMLEKEAHPDVRKEMLRALGRIGTPDAIQAILRASEGDGGGLFRGRKAASSRLDAVRAIALAGANGEAVLRTLAADKDPEVAEAATEALSRLPAERD